jgi:hypothetical protein
VVLAGDVACKGLRGVCQEQVVSELKVSLVLEFDFHLKESLFKRKVMEGKEVPDREVKLVFEHSYDLHTGVWISPCGTP